VLRAIVAALRARAGLERRGSVVKLDDVRRRLELLLTAVYDRSIPIAAIETPRKRPRSWWAHFRTPRHLRGGTAMSTTDGERIELPRAIAAETTEAALAEYRLLAVEQAERMARGTRAIVPSTEAMLERDLYLVREGMAVDAAIARTVPGLRSALVASREAALGTRPPLDTLTPLERAVESLVQDELRANPVGRASDADADPRRSASWAREIAARLRERESGHYRGIAPVEAWGTVRPIDPGESRAAPVVTDELPNLNDGKRGAGGPGMPNEESDGKAATTAAIKSDKPPADGGGTDGPADPRDGAPGQGAAAEGDTNEEGAPPTPAAEGGPRKGRARRPIPVEGGIEYPEWDWHGGDYRSHGAVVRPHPPDRANDTWPSEMLAKHGPLVRRLREKFDRLRARRVRLNQQREGDEIDIASCVRALVDQRTGHAVDDKLYVAVRPARRGLAITLLVDISGSTDEWLDHGQRIIDVEKIALLLASEALDALGDLYSVMTFSGKGRGNVRLRTIKDFMEPNGAPVRERISALEPEGYTRAGAAIRHAAALLERQPAGHRLLLIISDGKPNDVDAYDGLSAVEDTRQAIIETRQRGVYPFCLTIDRQGQQYLSRIFGEAGHTILRNPEQLPMALVKVVRHLLAS
jgi:nitric oxide reductase NorD protein